ncbi:MAG: hypothetical protein WCZ18_11055 [Ottowia sp.]
MMSNMMAGGMGGGMLFMGLGAILVIVVLVLVILALIKYLLGE